MINGAMMKQAVYSLRDSMRALDHDLNASRVEEIVTLHAMIGAAAGAAAAVVPGAGALIATGVAGTSVLTMYVRLADEMGITFRDGALRALASGVVADLSATILGNLAVIAALSFVPGVGSMSAGTLAAIANYGVVYLAAYIFLNMLAALLGSGKNLGNMSDKEFKAAADDVSKSIDAKKLMKEARSQFKSDKNKS